MFLKDHIWLYLYEAFFLGIQVQKERKQSSNSLSSLICLYFFNVNNDIKMKL